jgi:hypothetical protein
MSISEMQEIVADAYALVHDRAGFVGDAETTQAADDFLSAAEALVLPDAARIPGNSWRPSGEGVSADRPAEDQIESWVEHFLSGGPAPERRGRADRLSLGDSGSNRRVTVEDEPVPLVGAGFHRTT